MLPDAKRVLFTTGDIEGVKTGRWEICGLTCLICVLRFFGCRTCILLVRVSMVLKVVTFSSAIEVSPALALWSSSTDLMLAFGDAICILYVDGLSLRSSSTIWIR